MRYVFSLMLLAAAFFFFIGYVVGNESQGWRLFDQASSRDEIYAKGVNDALETLALYNLERSLYQQEPVSFGYMNNIVCTRLKVKCNR